MVVPITREHELAMEGRRRQVEDYVLELAGVMLEGDDLTRHEIEKLAQLSGEYVYELKEYERWSEIDAKEKEEKAEDGNKH